MSKRAVYRLDELAVLHQLPFVLDLVGGHPCFYLISQSLRGEPANVWAQFTSDTIGTFFAVRRHNWKMHYGSERDHFQNMQSIE